MRGHAFLHRVLLHEDPLLVVGSLEVLLAAAWILGVSALVGALVHRAHNGAILVPVQAHNLVFCLHLELHLELLRELLDLLGLGGDDRILLRKQVGDVLGAGNQSGM